MVPAFGCSNISATSAPVGNEFNQLMSRILRNEYKPMSLDRFVFTHLNTLND